MANVIASLPACVTAVGVSYACKKGRSKNEEKVGHFGAHILKIQEKSPNLVLGRQGEI